MLKTEFEFYEILTSKMLFPYLSRFRNYTEKRQITGRKYYRHFTNKTSSERDIEIEIEIEISLLTKSGPQEQIWGNRNQL
jgi:hypothetical protein